MSVVATSLPTGTRIWLAAGVTDMRKGFTGLSALVQNALASNPFCVLTAVKKRAYLAAKASDAIAAVV